MKLTIDIEKENIENLIDSRDIAIALVDNFADYNPDFWAEKIVKILPSVMEKYDLRSVIESIVEHLVFDIDIEQLVNDKIEELFEEVIRQQVQDKIRKVLGD